MIVTITKTVDPTRGTTYVAACDTDGVHVTSGVCYSRGQALATLEDRVRQYRARQPVVTVELTECPQDGDNGSGDS